MKRSRVVPSRTALATLFAPAALAAILAGCERMPSDMSRQPRYNAADSSPFFADAQAARRPVDGTVVHALGDVAMVSGGRAGRVVDAAGASSAEAASSAMSRPASGSTAGAFVERGRERYTIFCEPCHGARGDGDGEIVRRGFPAPPAFSGDALRAASDDRIRNAIVHGVGVMYPFGDRVSIDDATAIVGYVRVLQSHSPAASEAPR